MTDVPVSQEAREARIARYLSNEKAARESLATYPESTRQRLEAWQTEQCEWFSDTILEIVAEFITIDDAIRQQAERDAEESYKIGVEEGRQEMVREIDLATGGDGEFWYSTLPGRGCPDDEAMKARVIERFQQAERDVIARMEVVGWMYVRKANEIESAATLIHRRRWSPEQAKGWTETPLYALPTPLAGGA